MSPARPMSARREPEPAALDRAQTRLLTSSASTSGRCCATRSAVTSGPTWSALADDLLADAVTAG